MVIYYKYGILCFMNSHSFISFLHVMYDINIINGIFSNNPNHSNDIAVSVPLVNILLHIILIALSPIIPDTNGCGGGSLSMFLDRRTCIFIISYVSILPPSQILVNQGHFRPKYTRECFILN